MADTTISIRLGRVLYWIGCIIAGVVNLITIPSSILILFQDQYGALQRSLTVLLTGLVIGGIAWGIGKAARYILANEWKTNGQKQMIRPAEPADKVARAEVASEGNTDDEDPPGADAVMAIQIKCQIGTTFAGRMYDPDEDFKAQSTRYKRIRDECIALVDQIEDEFYRGAAVHQIINMCVVARDMTIARALLVSVRDDFLREKIFETAPAIRNANE